MKRGHRPEGDVARAERRQRVLAARLRGETFRVIAGREKISTQTAHSDMTTALADIPRAEADELRALELGRLDALQDAVWGEALDGDIPAGQQALRIIDRRARLLGLDAPTRVDMGVGDVDLDATVAKILAVAEIAVRGDQGE